MTQPVVLADRYRLDRLLGQGGMGQVWLAFDLVIHRHVAVKQLSGGTPDAQSIERALREARSAGSLHHPNAVAIYDVLTVDGLPYLVMEYVDGTTLAERLQRGALPVAEVARVGAQIAAALNAAHRLGITHRDVKPANILLARDGAAMLADFGIAHSAQLTQITEPGFFVGTIAFMAPEVAQGHRPTPAGDIWSLGATLWAAIEGRPVFEGTSPVAVLAQLISRPAPQATNAGPLTALLTRMLDRDPARRPTAQQVREQLAAASADQPTARMSEAMWTAGEPGSHGVPTWADSTAAIRPERRRRQRSTLTVILVAAVVVILAGAGIAFAALHKNSESGRALAASPAVRVKSPTSGPSSSVRTGSSSSTPPATTRTSSSPALGVVTTVPTLARLITYGPVIATGDATDSVGDGKADISRISWIVDSSTVVVDVFFAPQTKLGDNVNLNFDMDHNPKTGCDTGGNLTIGWLGPSAGVNSGEAVANSYQKDCDHSKTVTTRTTTRAYLHGYRFRIPRSQLLPAGPEVNFEITVSPNDDVNPDFDSIPNSGTLSMKLK